MENGTQSAKSLRRWHVEGSECCTAEIVEIHAPVASNEQSAAGIVAMLVAVAGSSRLAKTRAALWSHPQKAVRSLRKLSGSIRLGKSDAESFQVALRYRGRSVLRCACSTRESFSAAFIEHPGYTLFDRYFSISSDMPSGHSLPLDILIVVQPPQFSALEQQIQKLVPAELSLLNQILGNEYGVPLMITEQGCALGGLLSKIAAMTLRRGDGDISTVEQKQSGAGAGLATASTENKNLTGTAVAMLRQYLQAHM